MMKTAAILASASWFIIMLASLAFLSGLISATSLIVAASAETNDSRPVGTKIQDQADMCGVGGGALVVTDWTFDAGGNVAAVTTECFGGENNGTVCILTPNAGGCAQALTQNTGPGVPDLPDTADTGQSPRNQTTLPQNTTASSGGTAEVPTRGEEVTSTSMATTDEVVLACESLGGVATVDPHGGIGASNVHCRGGVLGGTTCIVGHYDTYCTFYRVTTDLTVPDGMTPESTADVLENVTGGGRIVVMSQSGNSTDNAKRQQAICNALGGTSEANYEYGEDGAVGFSDATCKGGLLDGMYCWNTPTNSVCMFMRAALPESTRVDSPAGNEVPAESAPVAPSPTVESTEVIVANPTPLPTSEPAVMPRRSRRSSRRRLLIHRSSRRRRPTMSWHRRARQRIR